MANRFANAELLKTQTIGVEIEMGCIDKDNVATIVADYFRQKYGHLDCLDEHAFEHYYDGSHHRDYVAIDHKGRKWRAMDDGSNEGDWGRISAEFVTPVLHYEDIEDLQALVRLFRKAGARSGAHYNSGVHIHVGVDADAEGGQTPKSIRNLVNLITSHEDILYKAIKVTPSRLGWCARVDRNFLERLNTKKPKTWDQLGVCWYGSQSNFNYGRNEHYHNSRYHLLNLHAIWDKGTIEFRCFEFHTNLHAGELKAWIQLCLAMCSYAKIVNHCSAEPIDASNQKYAVKNWLINMGLRGDEFKTCRKMLTKHLTGDTAYRNGRASNEDADDLVLDVIPPQYDEDGNLTFDI